MNESKRHRAIRRDTRLVAIMALVAVCAACTDGDSDRATDATGSPAARDFCAEQGFVEGERRNEAGDVIAECRPGPTPNGGAYSIALFSNEDGAADKDDATEVEITEYDEDGNVIEITFGTLGED